MTVSRCFCVLALLVSISACGGGGSDGGSAADDGPSAYSVERVFANLAFSQITDLQSDAAVAERLYVVQKNGVIRRFDPGDPTDGSAVFLDISNTADFNTGGEGGLLGLAFDPGFATNGQFYVHYTRANPRRVTISRFTFTGALPVDPATEQVVLSVDHPARDNHYGGALAFGPADGLLYLTMGDGGGAFDPDNNAQDRTQRLGKILRIDVSTTGLGNTPNYSIPSDNPFAANSNGFAEEIFAYGFRNPFRLSMDQPDLNTQTVWVADVGQNAREEVDIVERGGNYGWDCWEGTRVVSSNEGASSACAGSSDAAFIAPVTEYGRSVGRSITGGYVYRGSRLPGLVGRYIHGDFVSGRVFAYDPRSDTAERLASTDLQISTFGRDTTGALYIADFGGGLYRLNVN
ncbi:PQQ-dependent sugar dehydrogenase [Salinisphaera aquimarina]|uniref:PQQ-dependent sugar dehydrogenase n=1 Tax=Salinisphaera aquimarina TaxID=2094031 RepID=UPI0036D282BA